MNKLISNTNTTNFYNHILSLLNQCDFFIFNVAFINFSGIQLILDVLEQLNKKGIKGKVLTSTYLNFTDPLALEKLLMFKNIELKIFDSNKLKKGFHPKGFIFKIKDEYEIVIGSSNITSSALKSNIEWNVSKRLKKDDSFVLSIFNQFSSLWNESIIVDEKFIDAYSTYKNNIEYKKCFSLSQNNIEANSMQIEALNNIEVIRSKKEKKALIVAATGSGKTYLAAMDVKRIKPKTLIFIVHRENILIKAMQSFKTIINDVKYGLYTGTNKQNDCNYIFSTIQTISKYYSLFKKDQFDYMIIDEAHHCTSSSYKVILDYFNPKFLIGLTATPNRADGESIYKVFDDNLACNISLNNALEYKLTVPFHYFGVKDIVTIEYNSKDLNDVDILAKKFMLNKRVDFIAEKLNFYGFSGIKRKALGFCVNKEHAKYMASEFNKLGIDSIALTSEHSISFREKQIKMLSNDKHQLQIIFTVDIFNEGIDIPSVNTILMLRPTNSPIVFTQQLGRGLRKDDSKKFLTVIDFIGNHSKNFMFTLALLGNKKIDKESLKLAINNNFANINNCHIVIDKIVKSKIIEQIEKENFSKFTYLKEQYNSFKAYLNNKIPDILDYLSNEEYICLLEFVGFSKSYFEFLIKVENKNISKDFIDANKDLDFLKLIRFLEWLLPLRRPHEFVILSYLINNQSIDLLKAKIFISKYIKNLDDDSVFHSIKYLNFQYFDISQKRKYLKCIDIKSDSFTLTNEFSEILNIKFKKKYIENILEYGLLRYTSEFSVLNYKLPFLKTYEKYNMLNIAMVSNFNKIHSSFRGSGFLKFNNDFFLFITINKEKYKKGSLYINDFRSKKDFTFVSKPMHTQNKGDGQMLCNNKKYNKNLHIFARKSAKVDNITQKFIYLGLADTVKFSGNKPIKLDLRLRKPLSDELYEEFTKIV